MSLMLEMEDYYVPIDVEPSTREGESVKHFYYACESCKQRDTLVRKFFCSACNKEVSTTKIYPEGEKESVGSRDMWDFKRVPMNDVDDARVYRTMYVKTGEVNKPKARDIERWKAQIQRIGKSKTLKDLFIDLVTHNQAVFCKFVMNGKKNEGWIKPDMKEINLLLVVADGNKIRVPSTENYKTILQPIPEIPQQPIMLKEISDIQIQKS